MPKKTTLQLAPFADLSPLLSEGQLVALNVGPDDQLYAVIALKHLDYRRNSESGASFGKTIPDSPQSYRVVAIHEGTVTLDIGIANEQFNIHDIQPLPDNELLLVCCRSYYRGVNDFDKNGRVYSCSGQLVRTFLLGDGIQRVQTTLSGTIWTSFFDEGVFGNYGWSSPVGASGLVAWDNQGRKLYDFQPTNGLDSICDCYAMNVESESSTWLYYYTEFPLVHLRDQRVDSHWSTPLGGSSAFAVADGLALFSDGYNRRSDYHLFELGRKRTMTAVTKVDITDENDDRLNAELVVGRRDALYILRGNQVYRCSVQMAAQA
jgi:hypothetical protein